MNSYMKDIYKTLNILCVDDDDEILSIYTELFSIMFHKVYVAKNGEEGLESFKNDPIDIVLTDFKMPKSDGLDMSRKIRKLDSSVPIIMVTALESLGMLKEALEINITGFLKKPITSESLNKVFNLAVKSIIADRIIKKEQTEQLQYNFEQESLSFVKEQQILQNDAAKNKKIFDFSCDVIYKPKDILSGDAYVIREITPQQYFIFVVDSMGKGISASISAMLCAAFVNYMITSHKKENISTNLKDIIDAFIKFITPNLMDEEIISAHFLCFINSSKKLTYTSFSMPCILMEKGKEVTKIKSNNHPLSKYTTSFKTDTVSVEDVEKILIYTDGVNENFVNSAHEVYGEYLVDDFKKSANVNHFEELMCSKVQEQDDDMTLIYLNNERTTL